MIIWIVLGLVIAVITGGFTIIWWKIGDQWADDEYKKFGHGGGGPKGPPPKVISDFDQDSPSTPDAD